MGSAGYPAHLSKCPYASIVSSSSQFCSRWRIEGYNKVKYSVWDWLMQGVVRGGSDVCYCKETFAVEEIVWHSQATHVGLHQTKDYAKLETTPDYLRS